MVREVRERTPAPKAGHTWRHTEVMPNIQLPRGEKGNERERGWDPTSQFNLIIAGDGDNHPQSEGQSKKGHVEGGGARPEKEWREADRKSVNFVGKVQEEFTGISPMPGSRLNGNLCCTSY